MNTIMSKGAGYLLENGAKYRFQLSGKQLENAGKEIQKLTKNIVDPVVNVGINGRGAEGSIYGIKVFARGNKTPVAAAAGRIDYREADPILQARGFIRRNTGEGDALRANITLNTNKRFDVEGMDEFSLSKKKGEIEIKAESPWLKADIKEDKDALAEIGAYMGFLPQLQKGRAVMAANLRGIREHAAKSLNNLNPMNPKEFTIKAAKMDAKCVKNQIKPDDVEKMKEINFPNKERLSDFEKANVTDKNKVSDESISGYIKSLYK